MNVKCLPQNYHMNSYCMINRHLKSSSKIILGPFSTRLCPNMVTDKHWLKENILCLLSNAVKYSDRGTVTVTVSHVISASVPLQLQLPEESNPDLQRSLSRNPITDSRSSSSNRKTGILRFENLRKALPSDCILHQMDLPFHPPSSSSLQAKDTGLVELMNQKPDSQEIDPNSKKELKQLNTQGEIAMDEHIECVATEKTSCQVVAALQSRALLHNNDFYRG